MMLKVLTIAIFVLGFSQISSPHPKCIKPAFAERFNLTQLEGNVWYIPRILNTGGRFQINCTKGEFVSRIAGESFFSSMISYSTKNGDFIDDFYELTPEKNDSFIRQVLKDKSTKIYSHAAKYNQNIFVESVCFTNSETFLFHGYVIWSRYRNVSKTTLDDVVKKFKIKVVDSYDIPQSKDCFANK